MQLSVTITQYSEQHATIRNQYIAIYGLYKLHCELDTLFLSLILLTLAIMIDFSLQF